MSYYVDWLLNNVKTCEEIHEMVENFIYEDGYDEFIATTLAIETVVRKVEFASAIKFNEKEFVSIAKELSVRCGLEY